MDLDDFRRLLAYEDWANQEMFAAVRALADPPAKAVGLLGHLAASRTIWLDRLSGRPAGVVVWPGWDLEEIAARLDRLKGDWADYLGNLTAEGLVAPVVYVDMRGNPHTDRPVDILTHLGLHGPYHRGQIAMILGAAGATPPMTDFIIAVRRDLLH